jgi:hypothetical protein
MTHRSEVRIEAPMDLFFSLILKQNIRLVYWIFLNAHATVCELQRNLGEISFDDIVDSVQLTSESGSPLTREEILEYSGIIYEAVLKPKYQSLKGPSLCMKGESANNIENYFHEIIKSLEERKANSQQSMEEIERWLLSFKKEIESHLKQPAQQQQPPPQQSQQLQLQENERANIFSPAAAGGGYIYSPSSNSPTPSWANLQSSPSLGGMYPSNQQPQQSRFGGMMMNKRNFPNRIEIEGKVDSNEGVIRILQYIRKGGMDMVFPQLVHDKVSLRKSFFVYDFILICFYCV